MIALVAIVATAATVVSGQVTFPNAGAILKTTPEFSSFAAACNAAGLGVDKRFNDGRWEAHMYVPTNEAFAKFLAAKGTTLDVWLKGNKVAIQHLVLQHFVSTFFIGNFRELYNTQRQASLLTSINNRSRLTITRDRTGIYVASELTPKAKLGPLLLKGGNNNRLTVVAIDTVLEPSMTLPNPTLPAFADMSLYDVICNLPGLEDFCHATRKAFTVNAGLQTLISDKTKTFTLMAFNGEGLGPLVKLIKKSGDQIMNDAKLLDKIVRYHIVPGVRYDNATLAFHRTLPTLVPGHTVAMQFFNSHTVVRGDWPVRNRGKFWNYMPNKLSTIMRGVPIGSWDLPLGQSMVHVIDCALIPNAP